ncbi:MAG: RNA methyltransferase [Sphingobacteriales bacterium]|nr:MAG: RNA methyltransferase [Sphingobacteriales bacterium]
MLSKAQNKYIRSLSQQKYRKEHNVFIAEGDKIVKEWLQADDQIQMIVAVAAWAEQNKALINKHSEATLHVVNEQELESISTLQTPNQVLLVVHRPAQPQLDSIKGWCIALDNLQDPGNMGTIIRIADWFGIDHVVCSPNSADAYNPKVIQAAMGGHLRVQIHIADLHQFFGSTTLPVIAATLGGKNVYEMPKMQEGIIVIGNESKGIAQDIIDLAAHKVTIPRRGGAESLNAAVSAGILCSLLIS